MLPIASNKLIYYNHTLDLIRAFCLHNALVVALGQLTNHYFLSVSWLSRSTIPSLVTLKSLRICRKWWSRLLLWCFPMIDLLAKLALLRSMTRYLVIASGIATCTSMLTYYSRPGALRVARHVGHAWLGPMNTKPAKILSTREPQTRELKCGLYFYM